MARHSVAALNAMEPAAFVDLLGGIYEHSPWVARAAVAARPFASVAELHAAMQRVVAEAGVERQLRLLQSHPMLKAGPTTALTAASATEQAGIGLDRMTADDGAMLAALNQSYHARFGFPFIIAVRGQRDRAAILSMLQARLHNTPAQERATALVEVGKIARFRLDDLVADDA